MVKYTIPEEEYMDPGHVGCLGCGATLVMRYLLKALGTRTVVTIPACCWAVMPGIWPRRSLHSPLVYCAFEATGASASGLRAGLDVLGKEDVNVVGFAGDGGTADIGIQALSGMVERGTNAFYIMYDNEAYMNTGIQRSGSTPYGAWTTTTPVGSAGGWKTEAKKNVTEIMVAHRIPYVATASVAYPEDFIKKLRKAREIKGPKFFHVYAPCPTGWKSDPAIGIELARLVVQTRIFPMYEVENGVYKLTRKVPKPKPVLDYLKLQGRFRHLSTEMVDHIQQTTDAEWARLVNLVESTQPKE